MLENGTQHSVEQHAHQNQQILASIQRDVHILAPVVSKLDNSVEKLSDAINSISKLHAVQESRLSSIEKTLEASMQNHKAEMRQVANDHKAELKQVADDYKESIKAIQDKSEENSKRIKEVERWMWMLAGGAVVIGYLLNLFVL